MSGDLVPEKRMDVTGKVVTRHVRIDVVGKKSFNAPPPSVAIDHDRLDDAMNALAAPGVYPRIYTALFSSFSDSTLQMIAANVSSEDDAPVPVRDMITLLGDSAICERDIREYITFAPGIRETIDVSDALKTIRGLKHSYGITSYADLSDVENDVKAVCRVLLDLSIWSQEEEDDSRYEEMRGVGAMHYDPESHSVLPCIQAQAPGLVSVIHRYPERGNDIINFIRDRGYRNAEDLTDFLESGAHSSLMAGVL